jgi:chromosome partitioning protein
MNDAITRRGIGNAKGKFGDYRGHPISSQLSSTWFVFRLAETTATMLAIEQTCCKAGVVRITFGNLKGGVGKSTSSVFTSLGLAANGGRVLLDDADGTNRTCLKWSSTAEDWPSSVTVVSWEVPDLGRRVKAVADDYDHIVIDTGPQRPDILRQALTVTDDLIVTVAPSPVELEQLPDTFALAAEVDAISPTFAQVLFVKVRRGTRSAAEARNYLVERELPVMTTDIHLLESYTLAYGTVPADLGEYQAVLNELAATEAQP